jgi:hypothetical protein
MNAKLGSDGRLTLSGWLLNQLDFPDFAWRTKNSLWNALSLKKRELYVKKKKSQDMGSFVKTSCEGAKRFQSGMRMTDSLLYPLIYFSRFLGCIPDFSGLQIPLWNDFGSCIAILQ